MTLPVLIRLATVLAAGALGATGPASAADPGTGGDPCPPAAGGGMVGLTDKFHVWDLPGAATVEVRTDSPDEQDRTIWYRTEDITAWAGRDYIGVPYGSFVLPARATGTTIAISIIGDAVHEPPETFRVRLLCGAVFDNPEAIGTIMEPPSS